MGWFFGVMAIYGIAGILALFVAAIMVIVFIVRVFYTFYRMVQAETNPQAFKAWDDKKLQKTIKKIKRRL